MQNCDVDDKDAYSKLTEMVANKDVVILGSGASIIKYEDRIKKVASGKMIISANFIPNIYNADALFISNEKRLDTLDLASVGFVIATSNLKDGIENALFLIIHLCLEKVKHLTMQEQCL